MRAYRDLFALQPFRRLWLCLLGVMMADEVVRTTLVWHVFEATASSRAVGLLLVCLTAPIVLGGLLAGWLLDRYPRARVMAADTALRTLVIGIGAACVLAGWGGLAPLYAVAVVQGALLMVLLAGAPSAIAALVPENARSAANALEMLGFSAAFALGPVIAGLVIDRAGAGMALLLAGATYGVCAWSVSRMALGGGGAAARAPAPSLRGSGMLHPAIVAVTVMFLLVNIGSGMFQVWAPLAAQRLSGDAATYGGLLGLLGLGQAIGALLAGMVAPTPRLGLMIAAAQALSGAALLPFAAAIGWPLAAAAAFASGFFGGPMTVWAQTIRMGLIAPQWRGRAFAALRMVMQSGRPLGGAIGGEALLLLPLSACVALSVAVMTLPALAGALLPALRFVATPAPPTPRPPG